MDWGEIIDMKTVRKGQIFEKTKKNEKVSKTSCMKFSRLPKEAQNFLLSNTAKRFWEEYGVVIERLAQE